MAKSSTGLKKKAVIFRLAAADLKHEWILTLCLVLAVTAVLSPIFILFGLKYGMIQIYTSSLIQDPVNREIGSISSRNYKQEWFSEAGNRSDVAFVIPKTRQLSATIKGQLAGKDVSCELEMVPTGKGDPLLLENGSREPGIAECVLSEKAAEEMEAKVGDTLVANASRITDNRYEHGTFNLKIVGILPIRASVRKLIFVDLAVLERVERFKDGQSVPEYNWEGQLPTAFPVYDGLFIVTTDSLSESLKRKLTVGTGFTQSKDLDADGFKELAGISIDPGVNIFYLHTLKKPVEAKSIDTVKKRLRGKKFTLIPFVKPKELEITDGAKPVKAMKVYGYPFALSLPEDIHMTPRLEDSVDMFSIIGSEGEYASGSSLTAKLSNDSGGITFPMTYLPEKDLAPDTAYVPMSIMGILNLSSQRDIGYDTDSKKFLLERKGYASFRLYANTIYDVENLCAYLEDQGIVVHSELLEIRKVIQLTKYLNLVFWLIAGIGIAGTLCALVASLYASIERKKRDLGILRLLGISGAALFRFPIYQGMTIGFLGCAVALTIFQSFSILINRLFKVHVENLLGFKLELLQTQQSLCNIPLLYVILAIVLTVVIAGVASCIAAIRIAKIEPAEALRDE